MAGVIREELHRASNRALNISLLWQFIAARDYLSAEDMLTFLAQPLNLVAMSDLRSGVQSQTQEILHLPGVSEIVFF